MDKIKQYQQYLKEILEENAPISYTEKYEEYDVQVITDYENNHFFLMRMGWDGLKRFHYCVIHADIKPDGKIWIQHDNTEYSVANELVDKGVPKSDIVLAYQAPYRRKFSEFAIA